MYTLKKEERLCNKKLIDGLFHNGSSFLCYPFKVSWMFADAAQQFPVQVLFSVSKKRFKRAVDRNRIKRISREAYRLNKQVHLYQHLVNREKKITISLAYIGKELPGYDFAEKKIVKLLKQLCAEVLE
ncbi:MAG TPA: ribonuclease P protein component [Mucilaginibacter sp.]|jgi:ribonuclease P protein component|nr:ribonuclease P protein component [Mucilaginibacter sp.]